MTHGGSGLVAEIEAIVRRVVIEELAKLAPTSPPELVTVAVYAHARSISQSTVRAAIYEHRLEHVHILPSCSQAIQRSTMQRASWASQRAEASAAESHGLAGTTSTLQPVPAARARRYVRQLCDSTPIGDL